MRKTEALEELLELTPEIRINRDGINDFKKIIEWIDNGLTPEAIKKLAQYEIESMERTLASEKYEKIEYLESYLMEDKDEARRIQNLYRSKQATRGYLQKNPEKESLWKQGKIKLWGKTYQEALEDFSI